MESIIEKINESGVKFLEPLTPEETYATIVNEAVRLVNAEYGSIILYQDGEMKRIYSSSPLAFKTVPRKKGNTHKSFSERKVIIADIEETGTYHTELKKHGIQSSVFIPLFYQQKAIGVLTINSKQKITAIGNELKILRLFGAMASLAIRKLQLYTETQKALEVRDLFISLASHELRTPLTSINGYVQLLYTKIGKQETSEGRWVRELYEETGRLTGLVKELLEVNRIKQGQLHYILRECLFSDVINKAIERIKFLNPEREIVFENNVRKKNDLLIADSDKLLQMVTGLLNNAIKFSKDRTEIKITLDIDNEMIIMKIIDKGEGISKDDLPYIFDEFYKGDVDAPRQGMGVGLLLAKYIVTYHKGTISVQTAAGEGTTLEVKLPRVRYE